MISSTNRSARVITCRALRLPKRTDELFEHLHVQLHRPLRRHIGLRQHRGQPDHFFGQLPAPITTYARNISR